MCPWHWGMTNMTWGGQREPMNGEDCLTSSFLLPLPPLFLLLPLLLPPLSSSFLPSPDAVIDPWLQQLWEKLLSLLPLPPGMEPISDSVLYPQLKSHDLHILKHNHTNTSYFIGLIFNICRLPSRYKVMFVEESSRIRTRPSSPPPSSIPSREGPFPARLVSNDRLTPPTHFQDVRLITFDVQGSGIRYDRAKSHMV